MWEWFEVYKNGIAIFVTKIAFIVSISILAFSAFRYTKTRKEELTNIRYEKYHQLIRGISTGEDSDGLLRLVSQRAYIYELRHFPEYKVLAIRLL